MDELLGWLIANKIQHKQVDEDVVEIIGLGLMFFQDMEKVNSIFRTNNNDELIFNSMEDPEILANDGIDYIVFKFGDNWYYYKHSEPFQMNILKYVGEHTKLVHDVPFVNLGVHSPFELLNGSFMPNMWVTKAKYLGQSAVGVCDRNTMAGLFQLQKECQAAGITPVFGYSLTVANPSNVNNPKFGAKVYVQTQDGLRNLLRIQKAIMVDSEDQTIDIDTLLDLGRGNVFVFDKLSAPMIDTDLIEDFKDAFDKVFFQVDFSEYKAERIDVQILISQKHYFDRFYKVLEPVLICDCYYLDKDDSKNKIILNKVATGAAHEQSEDQYFKDTDELYESFESIFDADKWDVEQLFCECCANTALIAEGAKAAFETSRNFMPKYDMTPEETAKYGTSHNMFNELLEEGLQKLVPAEKREQYRKQMEYEKYIIESTNNVDYLLVQYDCINWCRRNGVLTGCGRGSAAGCLLLYLLGITLIDPIKYDLIFERFLLPERAGLYSGDTTIIGEDVDSSEYMEVTLESGQILQIDKDAELLVNREGEEIPIIIYADELQPNDDIIFDNKDLLFTLNDINQ